MATAFDLGGLLGNVFGGNEFDDLLTPQQRQAIQNQSMLSAAAALLQAGGPSRTRIGLGQALGGALEAGQAGAQRAQQSALTQMMTRQKMEEARQQRESEQALKDMLLGGAEAITPAQALAAPGMAPGPTQARAAMIGQEREPSGAFSGLSAAQRQLLAALPPAQAAAEGLKLLQPPAPSDKAKLLRELNLPVTVENLRLLEKPEVEPENIRTLRALNMPVTLENLQGLQKPESDPEAIKKLKALGLPITLENLQSLEKQPLEPENIRILRALNLPITIESLQGLQRPESDPENVKTLKALNLPVTLENLRLIQKPEADPEAIKKLKALGLPVTLENLRLIEKPEAEPENIRTLRALNLPVTIENLRNLQKPEATPSEVKILEATKTPVTLPNIMKLRQAGAASTTVDVRMPGNQQFLAGVGGDVSKTLGDLTQAARAATDTLATIERIRPVISEAVVGPAADYRTTMLRIGQQLGVAGQSETERLANTRTLVQGLAQMELDAAAGMRGQGALTDSERGILRRAAAGDQTLSAAELRSALSAAEKVANRRIQTQRQYLESARKLPGFEQFAPLYQVTPQSGGAAPSLLNSLDAEIQRRQQQAQPQRGR